MDLDQVPAEPVYTISLTPAGPLIDGEPVRVVSGQDDREAALAEVMERAARRGRPVRVTAHDAAGTAWLIVWPDGTVGSQATPHGAVAAVLPPPPVPFGRDTIPTPSLPEPPAPVPVGSGEGAPPLNGPGPESPAGELPEQFAEQAARMHAAESSGDLALARLLASELEGGLARDFGSGHPWTVHAATFCAWFLLKQGGPWRPAVEAAADAAIRRHQIGSVPFEDTERLARNAYAAWRRLHVEDPQSASALAQNVLSVLDALGLAHLSGELRAIDGTS